MLPLHARCQPLNAALRWVVLTFVALMLGVVSPAHVHMGPPPVNAHCPAHGVHTTLDSCCLGLMPDPSDPECQVCAFKSHIPTQGPAPLALPPWPVATAPRARALPRAPPVGAPDTGAPRAPPSFVKLT